MTTWASTTPSIRTSIQKFLDDGAFESSGTMYDYLLPWTNEIITEICTRINIREHLTSDSTGINLTLSGRSVALPTNFLKLGRDTKVRVLDEYIEIINIEDLKALDPNASTTTTGSYPDVVAIEGGYLYAYPVIACTAYIENYYRVPTAMSATTDTPDLPNDYMRTPLIIAGVCGKYGFPHLNEWELAKENYNDETFPEAGRFFKLLEAYRAWLQQSASVKYNQACDY